MIRFLLVILLIGIAVPASAKSPSIAITCGMIRGTAAKYGLTAVETWAEQHGVSKLNIQKAIKVCLKH